MRFQGTLLPQQGTKALAFGLQSEFGSHQEGEAPAEGAGDMSRPCEEVARYVHGRGQKFVSRGQQVLVDLSISRVPFRAPVFEPRPNGPWYRFACLMGSGKSPKFAASCPLHSGAY